MSTLLRRVGVGATTGALALSGLVAATVAPAQAFDPACTPAQPVLTSLKVSPTQVNVKTGTRTVVVSGTTSGPALSWVNVNGDPVGKGPDRSGSSYKPGRNSFSVRVVVPKGAANGKHMLGLYLGTADTGNSYDAEALQKLRMPNSFNVISRPDLKAPVLKKITLSTKKVNTTKKVAKVKVTATAKDAGGSGLQYAWVALGTPKKHVGWVSLSKKKGKLVGTMRVPKWLGGLKARTTSAQVTDVAGNVTTYGSGGKKLTRKLKPTLKVTSKKDSAKPKLVKASATPGSFTVGERRWQISYSVKASDTQSGVAGVTASLKLRGSDYDWGQSYAYLTLKKGTWTGKGTIQCYMEAGTYDVEYELRDAAGNYLTTKRGTVTITRARL